MSLDQAIREFYAAEHPEEGPVVAWVLVAATDNHGSDEEDVLFIESPDGQRGFVTTGLIAEAASIGAQRHTEDDE